MPLKATLLLLLLSLVHGFFTDFAGPIVPDDQICNPTGINFHYSGIRVYQTVLYDLPVRHFWLVAQCEGGRVHASQYFLANRTSNFEFAKPVCLKENDCFVFSRRKKYAERELAVFKPFAQVGTVYLWTNTNETVPLNTLIADNAALSFSVSIGLGKRMKLVPILSTTANLLIDGDCGEAGAKRLGTDPFERYEFSESDRREPWHLVNTLVNKIANVSQSMDKFAFWEFDALQNQLVGYDWRQRANRVLDML